MSNSDFEVETPDRELVYYDQCDIRYVILGYAQSSIRGHDTNDNTMINLGTHGLTAHFTIF